MTRKRKLLFFAPNVPHTGLGGGRIRDYYLVKYLAQHFDITLLAVHEPYLPREQYELGFIRPDQITVLGRNDRLANGPVYTNI